MADCYTSMLPLVAYLPSSSPQISFDNDSNQECNLKASAVFPTLLHFFVWQRHVHSHRDNRSNFQKAEDTRA